MQNSHIRLFFGVMALFLALSGCAAPTTAPAAGEQRPPACLSAKTARVLSSIQSSPKRAFAIDELLIGEPKTVTAVSTGITGKIGVDFETPANTAG